MEAIFCNEVDKSSWCSLTHKLLAAYSVNHVMNSHSFIHKEDLSTIMLKKNMVLQFSIAFQYKARMYRGHAALVNKNPHLMRRNTGALHSMYAFSHWCILKETTNSGLNVAYIYI